MATIMILENEDHLRRLYAEELELEGYQVLAGGHDDEALRMLQRLPVDLVIVELMTDDGNGFEWLQKIIALRRHVKIIINTAYAEFKQDFRCWGADEFIVKSLELSELKMAVQKQLNGAASAVSVRKI